MTSAGISSATYTIKNKEVFADNSLFPGDTVTLTFEIYGRTNYESTLGSIKLRMKDIYESSEYLSSLDTVEMSKVEEVFTKEIPINRKFTNEFDSLIEVQFIIPDYQIKIVSSTRVNVSIQYELQASNSEGVSLEPADRDFYFKFPNNVGDTNYTFKLYNNYVGKPFDDPTGIGFNLYTQEYLNTPCVLDNQCFQGTDYEESRFLELPTIYNMSYLPEANPEGKFFVPAFGNLNSFGSTSGLVELNNYNLERRFTFDNQDQENIRYYKIASSVEVRDVFFIRHDFIRFTIDADISNPVIYLRVLDIVEAAEDSYVEFEVFIDYRSMYIFNEYHGL